MVYRKRVDGYVFQYSEDHKMYECRGQVCYDYEHDEIPEPGLWRAALKLCDELRGESSINWEAQHSEKGWVEVANYE